MITPGEDDAQSAAHQALHAHFDDVEPPASRVADALRLVSGILPPVPTIDAEPRGGAPTPPATEGVADLAAVLAALALLRELRDELTDWEPRLIDAARTLGASWTQIAPSIGVASRQAAERRYLRLRSPRPDEGDSTGDQRVRNERDRRAEQRAVTDWARGHAVALRRLAARVADLGDDPTLDEPARRSVDRVEHALADNDTAALLTPLHEAGMTLHDSHPALARSIADLLRHTDALREDTRQRRADGRA